MDKFVKNAPQNIETKYYKLIPRAFAHIKYDDIYSEISAYLGKNHSRISAVCSDVISPYSNLNHVKWTPIIQQLRLSFGAAESQQECGVQIDYALVHLYKNGKSTIGWHSDTEAANSDVISVSFGTERKFCLREIDNPAAHFVFVLGHGDMFVMKKGCQQKYQHSIPVETTVNSSRISITFRETSATDDFVYIPAEGCAVFQYVPIAQKLCEKHCLSFKIVQHANHTYSEIPMYNVNHNSIALLKSNLQKAIRRCNIDAAVSSAWALISIAPLEFLRRIIIIAREDVGYVDCISIFAWMLVTVSYNVYTLTEFDKKLLLHFVAAICAPSFCGEGAEAASSKRMYDIKRAFWIRSLYGGTEHDMNMLKNDDAKCSAICEINPANTIVMPQSIVWLKEAIDFHVYPFMLTQLSNATNLEPNTIKKLIWNGESAINVRKPETIVRSDMVKRTREWKIIEPHLKNFVTKMYRNII